MLSSEGAEPPRPQQDGKRRSSPGDMRMTMPTAYMRPAQPANLPRWRWSVSGRDC